MSEWCQDSAKGLIECDVTHSQKNVQLKTTFADYLGPAKDEEAGCDLLSALMQHRPSNCIVLGAK